jgi:uncharacterized protein (TIGR00730 family)
LGANEGNHVAYKAAAIELGKELAKSKFTLVYGGGRFGLMGFLVDSVLENGGHVIGVIAQKLNALEGHANIKDMRVVNTMQERKLLMMELADAFLALPGGIGTLEEFFEVWNAAKLQIHSKPIGMLNTNGFFDKLQDFLSQILEEGFCKQSQFDILKVCTTPASLLKELLPAGY